MNKLLIVNLEEKKCPSIYNQILMGFGWVLNIDRELLKIAHTKVLIRLKIQEIGLSRDSLPTKLP